MWRFTHKIRYLMLWVYFRIHWEMYMLLEYIHRTVNERRIKNKPGFVLDLNVVVTMPTAVSTTNNESKS